MPDMYKNDPTMIRTNIVTSREDYQKRIDQLEDKVRLLGEQINKLSTMIELNQRQIRRQNTDVHNISTVLRNR